MFFLYVFYVFTRSVAVLPTETWNPAPALVAQKALEDQLLEETSQAQINDALAKNSYVNKVYDNIYSTNEIEDAAVKAEAGRRVADAALRIAQDQEAKANFYTARMVPI